jgi:hypothetical protein
MEGRGKEGVKKCREAASDGEISDRQGTWGEKGIITLYLNNWCPFSAPDRVERRFLLAAPAAVREDSGESKKR